jgi:hypothetical protein
MEPLFGGQAHPEGVAILMSANRHPSDTSDCPRWANRVVLTSADYFRSSPDKQTFSAATAIGCRRRDRVTSISRTIARSSAPRSDAGWLRTITLPRCPAATAKLSRKSFRSRGRWHAFSPSGRRKNVARARRQSGKPTTSPGKLKRCGATAAHRSVADDRSGHQRRLPTVFSFSR